MSIKALIILSDLQSFFINDTNIKSIADNIFIE